MKNSAAIVTDTTLDRAAATLIATAAGDALGAGYEFTHPALDATIEMKGGGPFNWAPGEWTDDTAMTIAVARGLRHATALSRRGLNAIANEFTTWYDTNPPDVGNQTRAVLAHHPRTAKHMSTIAASITGRTAGNGSLMRTAPVALAYLSDPQRCTGAARRISALTHPDPRAVQACALWAYTIRHALLHGDLNGPTRYLTELATPDERHYWSDKLHQAEHEDPSHFPNNGWVVHALQTAWWAITTTAHHPNPLPTALERAVRAGNDTDTTAAIAGSVLGALHGTTAIPEQWQQILHGYPTPTTGTTELRNLAHALITHSR